MSGNNITNKMKMNQKLGFQKGKELAILEYQKNGFLSLDSKSLIHFANGMCHFSVWFEPNPQNPQINKSMDSIDDFIQGFVEGYQHMIDKYDYQRGFLQFYFKS